MPSERRKRSYPDGPPCQCGHRRPDHHIGEGPCERCNCSEYRLPADYKEGE